MVFFSGFISAGDNETGVRDRDGGRKRERKGRERIEREKRNRDKQRYTEKKPDTEIERVHR